MKQISILVLILVTFYGCQNKEFSEHIVNRQNDFVISEKIVRNNAEIVINYYEDGDIASFSISDDNISVVVNNPIGGELMYQIFESSDTEPIGAYPPIN